MRLRLTGISHRSVEVVVVADPSVGTVPVHVRASYSRTLRFAHQGRCLAARAILSV